MDICEDNALCNESCMRRDFFWMMSILQPDQDRSRVWNRRPFTYPSDSYTTDNLKDNPEYQWFTVPFSKT
jgi:hypothetical protein